MTKEEIIDLINFKIGEYAGDELIYKSELSKANPFSHDFKVITYKYNSAIDKKFALIELLDAIEKDDKN